MKPGDLIKDIETGAIGIVIRKSDHYPCIYIHVYFGSNDPYSKYKTPHRVAPVTIKSIQRVI